MEVCGGDPGNKGFIPKKLTSSNGSSLVKSASSAKIYGDIRTLPSSLLPAASEFICSN
jgi:hypothetical protein